ncbi:MAG: FAD-dependent oxidoreductase, partial [Clostridia bacterium]|nr:FAD-dependent oxidoreductase [Clostridia bacterium]
MKKYDRIIIGAGLYGLYAALFCGRRGERVLVLECESAPFRRATYINQARVHQGYHYPRSLSTAEKSAGYFARFNRDFDFCIHREFNQ